jgi:DNA-binding response OmpR family regulator/HPt (histidine-containing phosphotransfer) domain-containing protein
MYSTDEKRAPRVLIADDDPVIRHWLNSILQSEGYDVVSMNDGRDAYRLLQSDADFNGAVFDLSMPFLEGPDLIRFMRTEKRLMRIPVMMITAEQNIAQVAKGLAAGATILLPKPFTRQRLQQTLRMMLSHERPGQVLKGTSLPSATRNSPQTKSIEQVKFEPSSHRAFMKTGPHDALAGPEPPVDLAVLRSLEDGDDDDASSLIVELIDLYRENGTRQVGEIKAAAAKMDEESLKHCAHALKGSSWTMGASRVGQLCAQLEQLARPGSSEAAELVRDLEKEFASAGVVFASERQRRLVPAFA